MTHPIHEILEALDNCITVSQGTVRIMDVMRLREKIGELARISATESGQKQSLARYLTRSIAIEAGVNLSSIHDLYMARGRGDVPLTFTVPAMNLRVLPFEAARAVFRVAKKINATAFIFEIARSEIGYTDQRPAEYTTSILAAAIAEGYKGPVFLQGDHFQISAKRYAANSNTEIETLRSLVKEAVAAGFYNIDIDTSTMVDLSQVTVPAQQLLNADLSSMLTTFIRASQPQGVTISIGGEIGEVGGHNSTEEELRAYIDGYMSGLNHMITGLTGLSKVSVQTGTSHGGVVLPDGSIAQVNVDFETLKKLGQVARSFGMGGAVQHGASTLPEDAFGKFVDAEACEIHLATNFMNMFFDFAPADLSRKMYGYIETKHAIDRTPDMTDEQFHYKFRKNALGVFKKQIWGLSEEFRLELLSKWEAQFEKLFASLGIANTRPYTDRFIKPVIIAPDLKYYLGEQASVEDVSDLAD
ncbi:MAG TPA: class II fructose-bisphosphate aldolase [Anaerolineaceae bacterium]|nr:class II fructose-bisphosphate aldolase [Anaerolineaceae bacterium]HPN50839.1 class II fructose-bisphosphate aldolase [Anaerolineaceae bacterium]